MSLGENIKRIRESKNITLENLAELTGISVSDCEKIEAGKRALTSSEIQSICKTLGVSFEALVTAPKPQPPVEEGSVLMPVDELKKLLGKMTE